MSSFQPASDMVGARTGAAGRSAVYSVESREASGISTRQQARCVFSSLDEDMTRDLPPAATRGWRAVVRVLRSPLLPLRRPLDDISSVLFPSPCRVCGDPLLRSGFSPVCDNCIGRVRSQLDPPGSSSGSLGRNTLCNRCGEHLGFESWLPVDRQICEMCRLAPPPFVRAVAYAVYQDEVRAMLHLLKYDRICAVAAPLGVMLAHAIAQSVAGLQPKGPQEMVLVAVPLFAARERQRGFNQSLLMCDVALRVLGRSIYTAPAHSGARPFTESAIGWSLKADHRLLVRCRETESQFRLTPSERRANLRGAFEAPLPEAVLGRHILLVDDIFTTGSTVRECASTLLRAGALSVRVATLSRAQPERATLWDTASFAASNKSEGVAPH